MKRDLILIATVAAIVYLAILFGSKYRGMGMGGMLQFVVGGWGVGLSIIAAGVIFAKHAVCRGNPSLRAGFRALALAAAFAGLLATRSVGEHLLREDVAAAKEYCDELRRTGRLSKGSAGTYPASQSELVSDDQLPRLLRGRIFYQSIEQGTEFTIWITRGFDDAWVYTSWRQSWERRT